MNRCYIYGLIPLILFLTACGDSDLLEDYFVDNPRILAVKIQDPEAQPGDSVAMRMLVGGKTIDQQMSSVVMWGIDDSELEYIGNSEYTQDFEYHIPAEDLEGIGWYDLPFYARIETGQKGLNAQKMIRITRNPMAKNPVVSSMWLQYTVADQPVDREVMNGDTVTITDGIPNVALTALTENLGPAANDKLVFRWYVSLSKNSDGMLYVQREEKKIEALLGAGAEASERRRSVVFSLNGKDNNKRIQTGVYDLYLVVRDNAADPQSQADERYGTDFLYFTLCVGPDC